VLAALRASAEKQAAAGHAGEAARLRALRADLEPSAPRPE